MSSTTTGIDAKAYLTGWLGGLAGMFAADIKAIPDDKWNVAMGGCTRPTSELVADALTLLRWTTEALKGNLGMGPESYGSDMVKQACSTKEGALGMLVESSTAFGEALNAASDEALNAIITPPWQMDAPLFMIAQIAVSHLWYHDGQLNYIQCLLGDDKVHWMGD